jgi:hypothetical protein
MSGIERSGATGGKSAGLRYDDATDNRTGWALFSGYLMVIGGIFNLIDGLVGVTNSNYYAMIAANHNIQLPVTNRIAIWGWVAIVFGVAIIAAGSGFIVGGYAWAGAIGAIVVSLNMVFRLAYLAAFPFWGLVMLFVDGLVLYGITVQRDRNATGQS